MHLNETQLETMRLDDNQRDVLQEVINIGVGHAAGVLNEMLSAHIKLQVPVVRICSAQEARPELLIMLGQGHLAAVRMTFTGSLEGKAHLIFPTESASKLVSALTDEAIGSPDLDAVKIGTLTEVGNIVINSVIGSISNLLKEKFSYHLPLYMEGSVEDLLNGSVAPEAIFLIAQTQFLIQSMQVCGNILLIFEVGYFDILMTKLGQEFDLAL
jgi:chemotaxis protein CheC